MPYTVGTVSTRKLSWNFFAGRQLIIATDVTGLGRLRH